MTRLPVEQVRIGKGVKGPQYELPAQCQNPSCDYLATDMHHIVRRSFIGGDHAWVEIDGVPRKNIAHLCYLCHREITENRACICWLDGWEWEEDNGRNPRPLDPPLNGAAFPGGKGGSVERANVAVSDQAAPLSLPAQPGQPAPELPEGTKIEFPSVGGAQVGPPTAESSEQPVPPGSKCPTCQRRVNKPRKDSSPKSKTISARLPADEKESFQQLLNDMSTAIGADELSYPISRTIEVGMLLIHDNLVDAQEIVREMKDAA